MSIQFFLEQILFNSGAIAMDPACCCEATVECHACPGTGNNAPAEYILTASGLTPQLCGQESLLNDVPIYCPYAGAVGYNTDADPSATGCYWSYAVPFGCYEAGSEVNPNLTYAFYWNVNSDGSFTAIAALAGGIYYLDDTPFQGCLVFSKTYDSMPDCLSYEDDLSYDATLTSYCDYSGLVGGDGLRPYYSGSIHVATPT